MVGRVMADYTSKGKERILWCVFLNLYIDSFPAWSLMPNHLCINELSLITFSFKSCCSSFFIQLGKHRSKVFRFSGDLIEQSAAYDSWQSTSQNIFLVETNVLLSTLMIGIRVITATCLNALLFSLPVF